MKNLLNIFICCMICFVYKIQASNVSDGFVDCFINSDFLLESPLILPDDSESIQDRFLAILSTECVPLLGKKGKFVYPCLRTKRSVESAIRSINNHAFPFSNMAKLKISNLLLSYYDFDKEIAIGTLELYAKKYNLLPRSVEKTIEYIEISYQKHLKKEEKKSMQLACQKDSEKSFAVLAKVCSDFYISTDPGDEEL